jgi:type IV pilus assembly protein PilW
LIRRSPALRRAARPPQHGLSMVELMVSITIGLLIVGAVLYVYLGSRGAYRTSKSTSRTQEAGRFGIDAITRDVRQTGFIGCGSRVSLTTLQPVVISQTALPALGFTSPGQAMVGYSASTYTSGASNPWPLVPTVAVAPVKVPWLAGDVLVMRVATASAVPMVADSVPATPAIFVANNCAGVTTDDYVLAGNCSSATVFRVSNAPAAACNASGAPVAGGVEIDYKPTDAGGNAINAAPTAQVFALATLPIAQPFDEVSYYVGQVAGRPWPALYRYSVRQNVSEEVIDHIENMSVYYGVDAAGNGNVVYQGAAAVQAAGSWDKVTGVRIQLMTVGDELNAVDAPQTIAFGDPAAPTRIVSPDTRYRQLFTATAALRDRLQ